MKQAFWFSCALILCLFGFGALHSIAAQAVSPTPDPFVVQLTSSPNAAFSTFVGDTTANGRFVVFTSNGNVATEQTDSRNNKDGNREIFLADYAQRRIFQITNTRSVPNPTPTPSPSPSPTASPSPTPTPVPTPEDLSLVKIQIDNRAPMISLAPQLVNGVRVYTIVFSSNAPNPANFDGTEGTLAQDGNSEIWIYRVPAVPDVDLTLGTDLPLTDLAAGTFSQITNTPASRLPTAGATGVTPFFADDNREATITDDGNLLAFISTRNLVPGVGNADGNPELFFYNLQSTALIQGTNTQDPVPGIGSVFQSNPNLSADGSVVAFISSANLAGTNDDDGHGKGNAEIYIANAGGAGLTNIRQVTRTKTSTTTPANVNVWSPGRRLSRDGAYLAFESLATDPKANSESNNAGLGMFVYTVATDSFVLVAPRPTTFADIGRFPTFTDYSASLSPSSLVFASSLNFRPDGTVPATAADAPQGLNPQIAPQIFLTQIPASNSNTFVRLTNVATALLAAVRPVTTDSHTRMAFAMPYDFGGGNADLSGEIFYLLSPIITTQSAAVLTFNTGASNMPVATATPLPSPTPTPTPTPSPSPDVALGLAPGELSIVRSTVALAPGDASVPIGAIIEEGKRSPTLPVELNGVSVSVNGAAAGLYFVGNSSKQINFVMPISAPIGLGTVAVNINDAGANTDTLLRGFVQIVSGQPDIFTSTNDAGGRAVVLNVTNPGARTVEPFSVTSPDAGGNIVPTVLELNLTGVRLASTAEVTVTVGTTAISAASITLVKSNPKMPGFDIIDFTLPDSLAGAGDVPIVVTFTRSGQTATTSRSTATAAHITIN
ncbi:MAG TPA: hypothetical protein VIX17_17125 [Pyrinomonadaceae bacterium]